MLFSVQMKEMKEMKEELAPVVGSLLSFLLFAQAVITCCLIRYYCHHCDLSLSLSFFLLLPSQHFFHIFVSLLKAASLPCLPGNDLVLASNFEIPITAQDVTFFVK